MTGAAALAARAALRADAGYVTICAPEESIPVLETLVLEAVKRPLEESFEAAAKASALAVGPGLGRGTDAKDARPAAARGGRAAGGRRRRRALRARARRAGRRRASSPRTRASSRACSAASRRRSPRTGSRRCGRPPSASTASSCSRARTRSSRRPDGGVLVSRTRPAVARNGRHGRRADRDHGRVPREGGRPAARSRGRVRGAAARFARSRPALRPRRERPDRGAAVSSRRVAGRRARSPRAPGSSRGRRSAPASRTRRGARRGRWRASPPS